MQKFSGVEYIKIAVANAFGLDKRNWDARLAWFNSHTWNFKNDIISMNLLFESADEPILMQKSLNAYHNALQGKPTGFIMGMDATASGLQIMACLIGCHRTAKAVNLIDTGKREDAYANIAEVMGSTRDICKKPGMTHFYGSKKQPEEVFGELIGKFLESMEETLPGACEVMVDMQSCWQPYALEHSWELPDRHTAKVKVMQTIDKKIEIDEMDHATFTHRVYVNEGQKTGLSLAANITHSVDGYVVREMYRLAEEQKFELLTIHDSFWASPNYMNNVRENYIDILADIADSNLLEEILRDVTGNPNLTFDKYSNNLGDLIRKSEYALS